METLVRLVDLDEFHPRLHWHPLLLATAAILREGGREPPHEFSLTVENIPGFGSETVHIQFDPTGISLDDVTRFKRTCEHARLVEFAAITVAAVGIHLAGGHQLMETAGRGTRADYLVDVGEHHLEIAGRSRRVDFEAAWQQKWDRLLEKRLGGFYICVSEFETLTGRLSYAVEERGGADASTGDGGK